jgi:hypothetical protein
MNGTKSNNSRMRRIGFAASSVPFGTLFLTLCAGNRNVSFGKSISERELRLLLGLSEVLFVGHGVSSLMAAMRWRIRLLVMKSQTKHD